MVEKGLYWKLNDDCHLRREEFGVLVYLPGGNCVELASPAEAVALALLDGQHTKSDVAQEIEERFKLESGEGHTFLTSIIQRYRGFMAGTSEAVRSQAKDRCPDSFIYDAPLWTPETLVTDYRFSAPVALTWIATRRCNFNCKYCYVDSNPTTEVSGEKLSQKRLKSLINEAADLGVASMMITGGEPLLVPGIMDTMEQAIHSGIWVDLNTNGSILSSTPKAQKLASIGLQEIVISIDSATADLHAQICGSTKDSFKDVISGIQNCLRAGIAVKTNTLLCSQTIPQLNALIDMLAELGVEKMLFSHYVGSFYNRRPDLFPSLKEYEGALEMLNRAVENYPHLSLEYPELERAIQCLRSGESPGVSRCDSLKRGLIIFPDGRVSFCDTLKGKGDDDAFMIGDLKTQTIADVWSDSRFRDLLSPCRSDFAGTACADCAHFNTCMSAGHCYSRALIRFGSGYAPDPFCPAVYRQIDRII